MNKKIFTLLVGAIMLIGSVVTVNAQLMSYPTLPYTYKENTPGVQITNFRDVLTATVVDTLPGVDGRYFLLSVTGIANASGQNATALANALISTTGLPTIHDLVLSIDSTSATQRYLRLEELWKLDHAYAYNYNGSHKFGALRSALWCAHYDPGVIPGSNIIFDFNQMSTGLSLQSPLIYDDDNQTLWEPAPDGTWIYKDGTMGINTFDEELIVNGWHFSQVVSNTQTLQGNMPLYSYVTKDTVVVLVLEEAAYDAPENTNPGGAEEARTGGWKVSVKHVALYDLIDESSTWGHVWPGPAIPGGRKRVENVLLFTLKKVNPFVMSALDWNAVNTTISFNNDANTQVTNQNPSKLNKYTNPFTDEVFNPLFAAEVNDSLYHYGYMNFQNTAATGSDPNARKWLYVDTAWVNYGNNQYLAFGWDARRDNAQKGWVTPGSTKLWGDSEPLCPGVDELEYLAGGEDYNDQAFVYWRMDSIVWAIMDTILLQAQDAFPLLDIVMDGTNTQPRFIFNDQFCNVTGTDVAYTLSQEMMDKYNEISTELQTKFSKTPSVSALAGGSWTWQNNGYAFGGGIVDGMLGPGGGIGFVKGTDYLMRDEPFTKSYAVQAGIYASYDDAVAACDAQNEKHMWTYMKDSIMENQAKFRVVYDPTEDSTFINVYQTRVAYPDFSGVNNGNIDNTPPWWTNSFGMKVVNSGPINTGGVVRMIRPSDLWTQDPYGGWGAATRTMEEAAAYYYDEISPLRPFFADEPVNIGVGGPPPNWVVEGHSQGDPATGLRQTNNNATDPSIFNFHSFMEFWPKSSLEGIDRVLISTADTVGLYREFISTGVGSPSFSALGHMYGWSTAERLNPYRYRDSLFYVDLQDLGGRTIITLDQSNLGGKKKLDTQIKLKFGTKCERDDDGTGVRATIENDLYLIRNTAGEYLCVPLWSTTDSIHWVVPEWYEDLTQIPSYQWAVMNLRNTPGSPFRLVNREFEKVDIRYAYVYANKKDNFVISGAYSNARFRTRGLLNGKGTTVAQALAKGSISPTKEFVRLLEERFALNEYSFIRLGKTVKEDQLLGYKYIDKDATYIDVYAFKHYNRIAGENLRYLSWRYDEQPEKPEIGAWGTDYYDKLYFNLQEMTPREIGNAAKDDKEWQQGYIRLTELNTRTGMENVDFRGLYTQLAAKDRLYTNADEVVLERFGYWQPYSITLIPDLKPLARQAYRLFLQDYYRWHPTIKGHYVTVGENDHYILDDADNAARAYDKTAGSTKGLFGIPHFYFRETFFEVNNKKDNDYFAIIQRLDTATAASDYFNWGIPTWSDMKEYMTRVFGSIVANKLIRLIELNRENQLAYMDIHSTFGYANFVIRGDAGVGSNVSSFQLEQDEDPIYRRFHVNEPEPEDFARWMKDNPDTLEFHVINQKDRFSGWGLYENAGNYTDSDQDDPYGKDGGRVYNRANNGRGDYFTDTLGHVISFLGFSNIAEGIEKERETNRSFYLDTAYINRGTGWIKPQYLIVVDPYNPLEEDDCDPNIGYDYNPNAQYLVGRFMYNTAMYAKKVVDRVQNEDLDWEYTDLLYDSKNPIQISETQYFTTGGYRFRSDNFNKVEPTNYDVFSTISKSTNLAPETGPESGKAYTYHTSSSIASKWERFAFAWAVHIGDSLYVLKGKDLAPAYQGNDIGDPKRVWQTLVDEYGGGYNKDKYVSFAELISKNIAETYYEAYYPLGDRSLYPEMRKFHKFKTLQQVIAEGRTIGLHAVIDLSDNTHKDWVFSFRYVERGSSDFVIESETSKRDIRNAAVIRPGYGGWLKVENGVPVITRPNQEEQKDIMAEAEHSVWNVHRGEARLSELPVGNDVVSDAVEVIGGAGSVTILNASGKNIVISNVLGQTIANTKLGSNNATIAAPAGIIVVAVEGEKAAKVVVK